MSTATLLPITVKDAAACCSPLVRDPLTTEQAIDLARSLKAISDPARLRLLSLIAASEGQEACVCDLTDLVDLGQPTVSHHLKVLADAGFLTRSKRGTWAFYALVPGSLDALSRLLITA
ncbi:MAG: metalloregulator ArsR/SmtB family transcription factor [Rhodoglobus sp.]|nr:metalloregulator ArsR/SmtB family transcription factor [Rhodoglobus sp.]